MNRFFKILAGVVLIVLVWGIWYTKQAFDYAKNPERSLKVPVQIQEGLGAAQIAQVLKDKKLIASEWVFRLYARVTGRAHLLKAGGFLVAENMRLPELLDLLVAGQKSERAVTFLEGWTARQMAEYLEEEGITTADAFLDCLKSCSFKTRVAQAEEGYLFPDTYFIDTTTYSDQALIQRLLTTFENRWQEAMGEADLGARTVEEVVNMASIVEREERRDSEKTHVAGILWNRYDAGIGLGADATVLYALGRTSGGLTRKDLAVDSPYNTRKFAGLPPTSISNPGLGSLKAALKPLQTPNWYYLHDTKGNVHYSETLEGHNQNKAKYLR